MATIDADTNSPANLPRLATGPQPPVVLALEKLQRPPPVAAAETASLPHPVGAFCEAQTAHGDTVDTVGAPGEICI